MARTTIYRETEFRILKNLGGRFVPQHKGAFSSRWQFFLELGVPVIRVRYSDAEKFIRNKAKVAHPHIGFVDLAQPSEREKRIQDLRILLARKRDKGYWCALLQHELAEFNRELAHAYTWLRMDGLPEAHIEQIEWECGLYQFPLRSEQPKPTHT